MPRFRHAITTSLTVCAALLPSVTRAQAPAAPTPTPTSLTTQAGPLRVERLAQLENPWGMAYLPDGRLLVTEKPGRLRIVAAGALTPTAITGVPRVASRGQGGLLDVAVDPAFATNGFVYLSYAELADSQPPAGARDPGDPRFGSFVDSTDAELKGGAVARARLDGTTLRDLKVIWRQLPKTIGRGHTGGRLVFGTDGTLFITSGDRMRFDPAQDSSTNIGKVVRINTDGTIPANNPFTGRAGASADVFAMGSRNAIGAALHPTTGQLWINEMGPAGGDEVNIILAGRNYGWPRVSNGDNYDGSQLPDHVRDSSFAKPAMSWIPSISPSGMIFHTGKLFTQWRGNVLLGGLSSMALFRLTLTGDKVTGSEMITVGKRVRDVIEAPDGAVLILTDGPTGELLRLTPAASRAP